MAGRWLDVAEAAQELGISTDAVRKRIARGTLKSDTQDGRRVVWRDDGGSDESDTLKSEIPASEALIEAKDAHIASLEKQLEAERRANEENRRIIAALTSRIPQLEAPSEPQNQPEAATEEPQEEIHPPRTRNGPQRSLSAAGGGGYGAHDRPACVHEGPARCHVALSNRTFPEDNIQRCTVQR